MPKNRTWYGAAGLLAAGALAGGILAGSLSAQAATGSGSTSTSSSAPSAPSSEAPGTPGDGHGAPSGGHAGETLLTGSRLATAKAAALKAVPGGTVVRAETDSGDSAYEVHMTKADGTEVTVKLDQNLSVTAVEAGMGK